MKIHDRARHDWTVVLRRQPARIVEGHPEGGYTDAFELICCDCGDDPDRDFCEVSLELQRIRGPYSIMDGITAYEKHIRRHKNVAAGPADRTDQPLPSRPLSTP